MKRMKLSWLVVWLAFSGLMVLACGESARICNDAGDCLGGEQCKEQRCVPADATEPEPSTEANVGPEPGAEAGPEVDPGTESGTESGTEPGPELVAEPPGEPDPKPTCGVGPACKPEQFCESGTCVSRLCGPCGGTTGLGCGTGQFCLQNQNTKESFCGRTCTTSDDCSPGFVCQAIGGQLGSQCVPPGATCKNAVGLGGTCRGADAPTCPHHYPYCSSLDANKDGVCTTTCKTVADCPSGLRRCADRGDGVLVCMKGCQTAADCPVGSKICADDGSGAKVCQKGCLSHRDCPLATPHCVDVKGSKECQGHPQQVGSEFCGVGAGNTKGVGLACPNGTSDCRGSAKLCVGQSNTSIKPFCTQSCTQDADCGEGAFCKTVASSSGTQQVCLPENCLCLEVPVVPQGSKDLMNEALSKVGRDRCSLRYSSQEMALIPPTIANDPFRLGFFDRLHREPLQFLHWGRGVVQKLDASLQKTGVAAVPDAIAKAAAWLDASVSTTPPSITVPSQHPLASAVETLIKDHGGTADSAKLQQDASDVPAALQQALAKIVLALSEAAKSRNNALPADVKANLQYYFDRAHTSYLLGTTPGMNFGSPQTPGKDYWVLSKDFGYKAMYQGAWNLASVIASSGLKADPSYKGFSFSQNTPLGRIIISDNNDHTYDPSDPNYTGAIALLVDTGGNDTYRIQAGANVSPSNGVSVLLDLAGSDKYGYVEKKGVHDIENRFVSDQDGRYNPPAYCLEKKDCGLFGNGGCINRACQKYCDVSNPCAQGACDFAKKYCTPLVNSYGPISLSNRNRQGGARLGIAFLFDFGAERDEYRSMRMSQGYAALGVGVLYDEGGDDTYQCEAGCQGAAGFGMGILLDHDGNDTYLTYHAAQGFAYARAAGLLLDAAGDDNYLADHGDPNQNFRGKKGDPLYLSAQLPGRGNSSFVQGAAFGRRADGSDGMFMSGGLAILRDRKGKDQYVCGVFGQGTGYWYGTGILADGDGDDTYDGLWYVQGATAHYAMSLMLEGSGNDKYNPNIQPRATHTGVGHDYSTSWLVDDSGNDNYRCAGLTLGAGNDNGYGFLIDNAGDDTYAPGNTNSVGRANSPNPDTNARNTQGVRTFGLFLDAGGTDIYTRSDGTTILGNNKTWTQGRSASTHPRSKLEHGVGVDGEGTSTVTAK